ncbi:MAG TPA: hypothetical protein VML75_09500 [Kofleriaceae bacterium]|nr:hypothetical protein [Kofleriaceae bacterium]
MARRLSEILEAIRSLSREEQSRLSTQLQRELDLGGSPQTGAIDPSSVIGLFSGEPELVDEVCEAAMQSRERDVLRLADG